MAVEFKLPDLGENVKSADIVDVLVNVGDVIAADQPVLEAETDKAVMEIPSTVAGKVTAVNVKKGETINVGHVVLTVDDSAAGGDGKAEEKPAKKEEAKQEAPAKQEEPASDSREAASSSAPEEKSAPPAPSAPSKPAAPRGAPVPAAPSVRQFAREIGIDVSLVEGSGPGGRISVDDVKHFARTQGTPGSKTAASGSAAKPAVQREPMSKVRKVTAAHMARCWNEVPHVTIFDKADVTDLEALRQKFKRKAEAAGGKLTITAMFMKITAAALKQFPTLNASLDMETAEIEYHNVYHLGCAADTPRGLVVPVLRDVDQKNIIELAVELTEISKKARDGKLLPDDMSGGTFTITNLGSIGTGFFTPIVNTPQVAILGMGRAVNEPVWDGKQFVPRLMAPLSLSFDHPLVDGADGARCLRWIIDAVENPLLMAM